MATDSIMGLFQDPQQYQQAQLQQQMKQNYDIAQMTPEQQVTGGLRTAGYQLGQGLGGLMGVEDPQMKLMGLRKQLAQGKDLTSSAGWASYAQELQANNDLEGAAKAAQKSTEIQSGAELKQAKLAQAKDIQTQRDQAALERQQERIAADIQRAKERGESEERIAKMQIEGRNQLAQMVAAMKQGQQASKPLSPGLQKEEDKDLAAIDSFAAQRSVLDSPIKALTADDKGMRALELGPLKNAKYEAQLALGRSTPEARAYENLKSAVDTAVNLKVSAEKGVQTDADVLRFAKALIASYGRNDTEATLQALKRYQDAIVKAEGDTKVRLESRRNSQGVGSYYGGSSSGSSKAVKWSDM